VAREVAARLGYVYPEELDSRVTAFVRRIQHAADGAASSGGPK
jgi:hypothetical protein